MLSACLVVIIHEPLCMLQIHMVFRVLKTYSFEWNAEWTVLRQIMTDSWDIYVSGYIDAHQRVCWEERWNIQDFAYIFDEIV